MNPKKRLAAVAGSLLILGAVFFMLSNFIAPSEDRASPATSEPRAVYAIACARCHGETGAGRGGNPRLRGRALPAGHVAERIRKGRRAMPRFPNIRGETLSNLAAYVSVWK